MVCYCIRASSRKVTHRRLHLLSFRSIPWMSPRNALDFSITWRLLTSICSRYFYYLSLPALLEYLLLVHFQFLLAARHLLTHILIFVYLDHSRFRGFVVAIKTHFQLFTVVLLSLAWYAKSVTRSDTITWLFHCPQRWQPSKKKNS